MNSAWSSYLSFAYVARLKGESEKRYVTTQPRATLPREDGAKREEVRSWSFELGLCIPDEIIGVRKINAYMYLNDLI